MQIGFDAVAAFPPRRWFAVPSGWGMMAPMIEADENGGRTLEDDLRAVARSRDRPAFARLFAFYGPAG